LALIAGGHSFGKTHGAGDAKLVGKEPEGASIEAQGLGWKSSFATGKGGDAITQRPRGRVEHDADQVEQRVLQAPVRVRLGADQEPGRCPSVADRRTVRVPARCLMRSTRRSVMRHRCDHRSRPALRPGLREDLAALLRASRPARGRVRARLVQADASRHGPIVRYLGPLVPKEQLPWQDPIPALDHPLIGAPDIAALKAQILASGLSVSQLVSTAWASAANLPRLRQARRCERGAHPPRAAEGLGGQRSAAAGAGAQDARNGAGGVSTRRSPVARRSRSPT